MKEGGGGRRQMRELNGEKKRKLSRLGLQNITGH